MYIDRQKIKTDFHRQNLEKTLEMLFSFDPKDYIGKDEPLNIKAPSASSVETEAQKMN